MESVEEPVDRPHYHSHALSRGLALLRLVAASEEPTTLSTMHTVTGNPKSTLVRLLSVLESEEYLVRVDERPSYRLGRGILPIAVAYLSVGDVTEALRPNMAELAAKTGWTANFGVLEDTGVLHMCVEYADRPLRYTASEGETAPVYCSGLGKAILASCPESVVPHYLPEQPFAAYTERTITTVDELVADLMKVKARGYATDDEESALGLKCVAVPVRDGEDVIGALSVSGPVGEFRGASEKDVVRTLQETANLLVSGSDLRDALVLARRKQRS